MTGFEVLLLGFGLGVRHAMDADHVVVVSTLVARESSAWRAAQIAALWGAGHTAAFLGLGVLVVLGGLHVPPVFEQLFEVVVAVMLCGFGLWHVARSVRPGPAAGSHASSALVRPLAVGMVHGLAGSAGVALLAVTAVPTRLLALVYLGLVAFGTVAGMVLLTLALARPLSWSVERRGLSRLIAPLASGGLGIAMGLWMLGRALSW
jgi:nickel/cobalt transporter (NicO) family protein